MFLDTSILIDIFRYNKGSKEFENIFERIENETLFISIFQLAEISNWALTNKIDPADTMRFVKKMANILPLNEVICIKAANIKHDLRKKGAKKFGLADGIILASARVIDQKLLTKDKDFNNVKDAIVIK